MSGIVPGSEIAGGKFVAGPGRRRQGIHGWRLSKLSPGRINRRAALILFGLVATVVTLYYPVKLFQEGALRRSALSQARKLADEGKLDQALVNVEGYLATWPNDIPGLELKGELTTKGMNSHAMALAGFQALDTLLRLDPDPPARQEDRKRLVELAIQLGDMARAGANQSKTGSDKEEVRYRYANKIAEQRIKHKEYPVDDAEAHRLLAMTLERLSLALTTQSGGNDEAGAEAIKEYQKALRRDPGDSISAERLAALRLERRKDQAGADQILDNLVKARPRSVDARLVRARHFLKTGREERAKADIEAASRLDATNKGVRIMAASLALRRGDSALARRHLAAIPEKEREDSRLDVLLAQLEFQERRPEQAIQKLRAGLIRTLGTDRELTWRMAYCLIQLGRVAEARPLMAQFRRLTGRDNHPMLRFLEGSLREKVGRHSSAIIELESAREDIDGEWRGELDMVLGRCHEAIGDFEAAEDDFRKARDASPSSPGPRQSLARLLLRSEPDRAVAELEEGLRFSPGLPSLLAELAMIHVARQLALPAERRDWSAALAAIDRGLRAKPDDPTVIRARARVLAAAGRLDEADSILEEATKGPARRLDEVWLTRAEFLENRGQFIEALRVLEQASSPDASGDLASIRAARASILARTGHGRASLGLLAIDVEKFSTPDRVILARDKANLLLSLGDRAGARLACLEWAGLAPEDPGPGLKLVDMARRGGTVEELDQGVALLRKVGGDDEPIALAAQAMAILLPDGRSGEDGQTVVSRLDEAEAFSQRLLEVAPKLPITSLIRALLFEQSSEFEEAIVEYKQAIKKDNTGIALPRLVGLLNRLKRDEELATLKTQSPAIASKIDRITLGETLGSGDKVQAETLLARLVEDQPDSLEYRADLARILRDLGKPDQAEATLKALVDRRPERPQPWLALLALQLERGDRPAASATVERLKTAYKGDRPDLLQARCLWAIGDRAEAARVCERELARQPDDLAMIQLASEMEELNGRSDRAEALIARAGKINPKLPWVRRRMALILSGRPNYSRWAEARMLVDSAASQSADSTDSTEDRFVRAMVLERGPNPAHRAEAITVLRSLVDDVSVAHPIGRKARVNLARLLMATGDPAGTADAIAPATADSASPDAATLAIAVEALALAGKPEEARRQLDRLEKASPDLPATIACRALVLKAEGDPEAAARALVEAAASAEKASNGEQLNRFYFDQLARLGPGVDAAAEQFGRKLAARWPAQWASLARFLIARGRVDEALEACRLAIEAGQAREPLQLILALFSGGRLEGTLAEKARDLTLAAPFRAPKDADVLAMTTSVLRQQRRFEEEAALYRKLLATDPSNVVARNNLAWVLGQDLNKAAEALVEVDRVIRQVGPLPQAIDTRGMILAKLGRLDEAIVDLQNATRVDPSAIHHIHLARVYAQAGRQDDRRRTLEAARLATSNPNALEPEDRAELDATNLH